MFEGKHIICILGEFGTKMVGNLPEETIWGLGKSREGVYKGT